MNLGVFNNIKKVTYSNPLINPIELFLNGLCFMTKSNFMLLYQIHLLVYNLEQKIEIVK